MDQRTRAMSIEGRCDYDGQKTSMKYIMDGMNGWMDLGRGK